jgi:activating signal cointegrator 1
VKAITLTQPWATLVAIGAKRIETRGWSTVYRGELAIHAAKGFPRACRELVRERPFRDALHPFGYIASDQLPVGAVVSVVQLTDVAPTDDVTTEAALFQSSPWERAFGNYDRGRFAWFLDETRRLSTPAPCRGALSLWDLPADVEALVREQLP